MEVCWLSTFFNPADGLTWAPPNGGSNLRYLGFRRIVIARGDIVGVAEFEDLWRDLDTQRVSFACVRVHMQSLL
jgi:hypothetical protein